MTVAGHNRALVRVLYDLIFALVLLSHCFMAWLKLEGWQEAPGGPTRWLLAHCILMIPVGVLLARGYRPLMMPLVIAAGVLGATMALTQLPVYLARFADVMIFPDRLLAPLSGLPALQKAGVEVLAVQMALLTWVWLVKRRA